MANKRRSKDELKKIDALLERLREFIRLNYMTAAEVARQIGVRDTTIYSWLLGQARPAEPKPIAAFLDSLPRENGSGVAPNGYEYREYKNWRGIPKPRRCPFCKETKGTFEEVVAGFLEFVQIAMRGGRSGRAGMRRYGRGMARVKWIKEHCWNTVFGGEELSMVRSLKEKDWFFKETRRVQVADYKGRVTFTPLPFWLVNRNRLVKHRLTVLTLGPAIAGAIFR